MWYFATQPAVKGNRLPALDGGRARDLPLLVPVIVKSAQIARGLNSILCGVLANNCQHALVFAFFLVVFSSLPRPFFPVDMVWCVDFRGGLTSCFSGPIDLVPLAGIPSGCGFGRIFVRGYRFAQPTANGFRSLRDRKIDSISRWKGF